MAGFDKVTSYGLSRTTSDIQNRTAVRQKCQKSIEPRLFKKVSPPFPVPPERVTVVEFGDPLGSIRSLRL